MRFTKITTLGLAAMMVAGTGTAVADMPDDWNYSDLYDDFQLSRVLDGEVYTVGGIEVGDVEDIILGPAGLVQSVVVRKAGDLGPERDFYRVGWADVDFNPLLGSVTLEETLSEAKDMKTFESVSEMVNEDQWRAEKLIGMQASVDSVKPYAEIADLLVTQGSNALSAFVVDPDGLETENYAVPADMDWVNWSQQVVKLPYSLDDVEALDEFEIVVLG